MLEIRGATVGKTTGKMRKKVGQEKRWQDIKDQPSPKVLRIWEVVALTRGRYFGSRYTDES